MDCTAGDRLVIASLAALCYLSYQDPAAVKVAFCEEKGKCADKLMNLALRHVTSEPQYIECTDCDANAYIMQWKPPVDSTVVKIGKKYDDVFLVVVRGTNSFMDALLDVQLQFVDFDGGVAHVHRGFHKQYSDLCSDLDGQIREHLTAGRNVAFTGHSAGAAVSTLFAAHYASQFHDQIACVNFGCPRVGDAQFKALVDAGKYAQIRVKNSQDPVTKIPPPLRYVHCGVEVHCGDEDPYPAFPFLTDIADHQIKTYCANTMSQYPAIAPQSTTITESRKSWLLQALDEYRRPPTKKSSWWQIFSFFKV
jgi:hypothetical protein